MRLDKLKTQYQRELIPLTDERGALLREVAELKAARDVFLEETTMLNARNEELAQLNALYARRNESSMPENTEQDTSREKKSGSFDRQRPPMGTIEPSNTVLTTNSLGTDESADSSVYIKVSKTDAEAPPTLRGKLRWPGRLIKETTPSSAVAVPEVEKPMGAKHVFQQISLLRFTRCDYCSDKLWGSQVRCSGKPAWCLREVHSSDVLMRLSVSLQLLGPSSLPEPCRVGLHATGPSPGRVGVGRSIAYVQFHKRSSISHASRDSPIYVWARSHRAGTGGFEGRRPNGTGHCREVHRCRRELRYADPCLPRAIDPSHLTRSATPFQRWNTRASIARPEGLDNRRLSPNCSSEATTPPSTFGTRTSSTTSAASPPSSRRTSDRCRIHL